jgi:hypothetical protein
VINIVVIPNPVERASSADAEKPHEQINTRRVERDIYDGDPGLDKRGLWERSKL